MSRIWTAAEYATLAALAPNWPRAARVLQRPVRSCREHWQAGPPRRSPAHDDLQDLLALLILGQRAGLAVADTIEYFHLLSRHQGSSWRLDGRFLRTGAWEVVGTGSRRTGSPAQGGHPTAS